MVRHAAAGAGAERVLAPGVLYFRKSAGRVKAAAGKHCFAVETGLRILQCVNLDHAPHFPAIFGGETRGIDAQRIDTIGVNLRAEAGRAVVG